MSLRGVPIYRDDAAISFEQLIEMSSEIASPAD